MTAAVVRYGLIGDAQIAMEQIGSNAYGPIYAMRNVGVDAAGNIVAGSTNANPGSDATMAQAVQGVTNGKPVEVRDGGLDAAVRTPTSVSSAAVAETFSTLGYSAVFLQCVANAGGNTISVEGSNDGGTTWTLMLLRNCNASAASTGSYLSAVPVATQTYVVQANMPLMRWRVSTFASGTTTMAVGLKRNMNWGTVESYIGNASLAGFNNNGGVVESNTALSAGAAYTGAGRLSSTNFSFYNVSFYADTAGTCYLEQSTDSGVTWRPANASTGTALTGGTPVLIRTPITAGAYRARFVQGASPSTVLQITSSQTAA